MKTYNKDDNHPMISPARGGGLAVVELPRLIDFYQWLSSPGLTGYLCP